MSKYRMIDEAYFGYGHEKYGTRQPLEATCSICKCPQGFYTLEDFSGRIKPACVTCVKAQTGIDPKNKQMPITL